MNSGDEFSELQEPENREQQQSDEGDETIPASTSHEPPSTTNQASTSRREPVINEGYGFFEREETEEGGHITQQQSDEGDETIPASTSHEPPSTTNQAGTSGQEFEDPLHIEFCDFEALDDAHRQSFISENINTGQDVGFNELMQIAEQKSFISEKIPASTSQGTSWTNQETIKMPFMSMTKEPIEEIKMIPTPGFNAHGSSSSLTNVLGQGHNSPSYLEDQTQAINATSTSRNQESAWSIKKRLTKTDISRGWVLLDKSSVMDHIKDHLSSNQHNFANVVEGMPGVELRVCDYDMNTEHKLRLVFRKNYFLGGDFKNQFIKKRGLKEGDEIGLSWDTSLSMFRFSLLSRAVA